MLRHGSAAMGSLGTAGSSGFSPLGMTRSTPGTRWELAGLPSTSHRQLCGHGGSTGCLFSCENKVTFLVSFKCEIFSPFPALSWRARGF